MKLNIVDEFSPLKKVAVSFGTEIPKCEDYIPTDPQEIKWGWTKWDQKLLIKQQADFFTRLQKYDVELIEIKTKPHLIWQMYTRDVAFVIGQHLYYADKRTLLDRNGEIELLLQALHLDKEQVRIVTGKIEGGDVLAINNGALVGVSNRTNKTAIASLSKQITVRPVTIGDNVMHLDTVLTLLPRNYALYCPDFFSEADRTFLQQTFKLIPVTKDERTFLGTNVFVVNPETIFVEASQKRIQDELTRVKFKVESVPYSEPIALGGSFRCTTLPLVRS